MLRLGWFSTGRGEGSRGLYTCVKDAIDRGELRAEIAFVFCNREPGEHEGSDGFMELARSHGIPVVALSSQRFRRERGAARFADVREAYDDAVMALLAEHSADYNVTAGYGLIFGAEMVRSRPALNPHPAAPDGPVGTWQQVIWQLIETRATESGAFVHLATEELDRGPVIAYVTFPIRGAGFDELWPEAEAQTVAELQSKHGEELPLMQAIRRQGVLRERPLLLEALKAVAEGRVRVEGSAVVDGAGRPAGPLCLNIEVERAVAATEQPAPGPQE
ncbi:MAG: formyltransferase family protein [Chloroflexi bacterium]|nr:formyltransferase family protein [Chloroflexota bacterium]